MSAQVEICGTNFEFDFLKLYNFLAITSQSPQSAAPKELAHWCDRKFCNQNDVLWH